MPVRQRPAVGLVAVLGYLVVLTMTWLVQGVDYTTVGDSARNLARGVVLPVALGTAFLVAVTTWLGWWRPAIREDRVVAPRWTLAVPATMALVAVLNVGSIRFGSVDPAWVVALVLGVCLVGFAEELLTRGLVLVGLRGRLTETWCWLLTSLLFGLVHGVNVLFGQSAGDTLQQMAVAFLSGSALYVARMATGTLVTAMVLHALWDLGALGVQGSGAAGGLTGVAAVLGLGLYALALGAAVVITRRATHPLPSAQPRPAA